MKSLFTLFLLFITSIFTGNIYSQLADNNTYLLKHLNPRPTAHQYKYSACWGYRAPNGREYAIIGSQPGTSFVDITDSANIHEVGFVAGLTSEWREMKVYSHYAYIVSEATGSKLQIVDLQYLPDSVHLVTTWGYGTYTRTHSISQSGPYLYLNGGNSAPNGGITVVNIADPINPVKMGQWTTLYVHDCRIWKDTIWAANIYTGQTSIINATNKSNLSTIRTFQSYPQSTVSTHNCALTTDRKYLLTTNEVDTPPGQLNVWDVQDLNNITYVTQWQPTNLTTTIVHNVEIYGNYAVIAHYTAGIRIVNISNPIVPTEVAWYDTYKRDNSTNYLGCWGVYMFPSGKIIGSDTDSGLYVVKTNFKITPPIKINLTIFPEGFYDPASNQLFRKDSVTVYLRSAVSPYQYVDSSRAVIDSLSLAGLFTFSNAVSGSYYIVVKHFNSIETWSKSGGENILTDGSVYNYDFTTSGSQAYGNNLVLKGSKYCMYGGDVNQNGIIDLTDVLITYNDVAVFTSGLRLPTDLNGDNFVDLSDLTICYNNSSNIISVISPLSSTDLRSKDKDIIH